MAKRTDRRSQALEDHAVREWYDGLALRSRTGADVAVRNLSRVLEISGLEVGELLATAKRNPRSLQRSLVQYVEKMKSGGRTSAYLEKTLQSLRSFLRSRHVAFDDFPPLHVVGGTTLSAERVPMPQELGRILAALSLRWRAAALLIAHAGLRPGVLCSSPSRTDGAPALRLSHIVDLDIDTLTFRKIPFQVWVPPELSKTGRGYTTFGGAEAAEALKAYLRQRGEPHFGLGSGGRRIEVPGEVLTADSYVIAGALSGERATRGEPVTTQTLTEGLRNGIRKVVPSGTRWRPYVLRAYCSTRLMLAESRGSIVRDLREALMGHSMGVSSRYNVGKKWGVDLLEEARRQYSASEPYLSTVGSQREVDARLGVHRAILEGSGLKLSDKERQFLLGLESDDFLAELGRRLTPDHSHEAVPRPRKGERRTVSVSEADAFFKAGWEPMFGAGDRVIIRGPN